jgi:ADP-ribose pyrophosphatase
VLALRLFRYRFVLVLLGRFVLHGLCMIPAYGELMELIESRRAYEGRVINVRVDTVLTPKGEHTYEVVEHSGAVAVIVAPSPSQLVLVHQYRAPLAKYTWEVCAGGIDPGEEPLAAALRELREETGFRARSMRRLWTAYSAPGFCTELLHFFVTDDFEPGATEFDEGEDIEIRTFELDELQAMIRADQLPDAKTQIAVMWALSAR